MAFLTLAEAARTSQDETLRTAAWATVNRSPLLVGGRNIELSAASPIGVLPFKTMTRPDFTFRRESTRGSAVWYSHGDDIVNEVATTTSVTVTIKFIARGVEVPNTLLATESADFDNLGYQTKQAFHAVVDEAMTAFYYGSTTTNPNVPNGAQNSVDSANVIERGSSSAAGTLRVQDFDNMIVNNMKMGVDLIVCSGAVYRLLQAASRSTSVSGTIQFGPDQFGKHTNNYNGIPVWIDDYILNTESTVTTTYDAPTGGTNNSSVFFFKFGEDTLHGLVSDVPGGMAGMSIVPVSDNMEKKDNSLWRVRWYVNPLVRISRYGLGIITGAASTTAITA